MEAKINIITLIIFIAALSARDYWLRRKRN
jgi:hypothetical protein